MNTLVQVGSELPVQAEVPRMREQPRFAAALDWPRPKIKSKLAAIRQELREIEAQLADTTGKLEVGRQSPGSPGRPTGVLPTWQQCGEASGRQGYLR